MDSETRNTQATKGTRHALLSVAHSVGNNMTETMTNLMT